MALKQLKDYSVELVKIKNQPKKLMNMYADLAARYSYLAEDKKGLRIKRAQFWQENMYKDGKQLSDKKIEMAWLLTADGYNYDLLKIDMDAAKTLMDAIKSISITNNHEIKNEY